VLGRLGQAFSTRARAEQIRAEIEQLAVDSPDVLIDFEGVRSVSYSFADELVGVFASRYEADSDSLRPVVIGLSAQAQRVLIGSLEQRGLSDETSRALVPR
jgi:anti-anti-sigma regulatory factor